MWICSFLPKVACFFSEAKQGLHFDLLAQCLSNVFLLCPSDDHSCCCHRMKTRKTAHLGFVLCPSFSRGGQQNWRKGLSLYSSRGITHMLLSVLEFSGLTKTHWAVSAEGLPQPRPLDQRELGLSPAAMCAYHCLVKYLCSCVFLDETGKAEGVAGCPELACANPLNSCLWTHLLEIKCNGFHQSSLDMTLGQDFASAAVFSFASHRSAHPFWPGSFKTQLTEGRAL